VNWFRHYAFGSHVGEWLALALVILLTFALWLPCEDLSSGSLSGANAIQTKARATIGAYMEDKSVASTQEIVCAFRSNSQQFLRPSTGLTPRRAKALAQEKVSQCDAISLR